MSAGQPRFTVGSAPHWRRNSSLFRMNHAFILALVPMAVLGAIVHAFGWRNVQLDGAFGPINPMLSTAVNEMGVDSGALWLLGIFGTLALGMGTAVIVEYVSQIIFRQPYQATNGHGLLMGLLVVLLSPPSIPWWVLIVGVTVAIVLGKQLFGGIGSFPMHPAMVGWLIVLLSWPHHLYPVGSASIGAPHPAVVGLTALGGIALCLTGYIRWQIPLGVLIGVALSFFAFSGSLSGDLLHQFTTGHVVLAAFFIATDSTTSPANRLAAFLSGLLTGVMIMLIRAYGIWPDAVPFAILLVNVLSPHLDRIRPKMRLVVA